MKNWMTVLAAHYEKIRQNFPDDRLLIAFDIDGTILDMRHLIWRLLQTYDRKNGTKFFQNLTLRDITVHEDQIEPLLDQLKIEPFQKQKILAWYKVHAWSSAATREAHRPFSGVLEVIRWFQLQPQTNVGLNTGRPESLRTGTLRSLNKLGQEYKITFSSDLLFMRPDDYDDVAASKMVGVSYFQQKGYRIFACIDNEPDNLQAISSVDPSHEILLLHADTLFRSKRTKLPARAVAGKGYTLADLIPREALPQHIQFVWYGLNDSTNLSQFLNSEVRWGEFELRPNPWLSDLLPQPGFNETLLPQDEAWYAFDFTLARIRDQHKGIKINLNAGPETIERVLARVKIYDYDQADLWFSGRVEDLLEAGFGRIAAAYPGAIIECPVDFLAPLIVSAPAKAREILDLLATWGINRFAIQWRPPISHQFFDQMDQWGFEVNIDHVPDLETFLQAVLLMPRSITSNFNFPQWHFYGKDPFENGRQADSLRELSLNF